MEPFLAPPGGDGVVTSFDQHRNLNLPPCYGFKASDEQLLRLFLQPFVDGKELTTCPIHTIEDVYGATPEVLTGLYERGTDTEWFFFGIKRYSCVGSRVNRAITGGVWKHKGNPQNVYVNETIFGVKRTQDFYGEGLDYANWRMEEFSLTAAKSTHILAKIFAVPNTKKRKSISSSTSIIVEPNTTQQTPYLETDNQALFYPQTQQTETPFYPTTHQTQDQALSLPHHLTHQTGTLPHHLTQQTDIYQFLTADETVTYARDQEFREWMSNTFPDSSKTSSSKMQKKR